MENFYETVLKAPMNIGHRFCGVELQHRKHFLRLFQVFQFHKCLRFNTEYNFHNHYMKVANKSFEKVAELEYLRRLVANQSCIHEEIKGTKFRECLLPYCSESLVTPPCVWKHKD
jgi:hypothetical protein